MPSLPLSAKLIIIQLFLQFVLVLLMNNKKMFSNFNSDMIQPQLITDLLISDQTPLLLSINEMNLLLLVFLIITYGFVVLLSYLFLSKTANRLLPLLIVESILVITLFITLASFFTVGVVIRAFAWPAIVLISALGFTFGASMIIPVFLVWAAVLYAIWYWASGLKSVKHSSSS